MFAKRNIVRTCFAAKQQYKFLFNNSNANTLLYSKSAILPSPVQVNNYFYNNNKNNNNHMKCMAAHFKNNFNKSTTTTTTTIRQYHKSHISNNNNNTPVSEPFIEKIKISELPQWFQDLRNDEQNSRLAEEFDVKWYDEAERKEFDWETIVRNESRIEEGEGRDVGAMWEHSSQITNADKRLLSGGNENRHYILVGEGYRFADYRDLPFACSTSRPTYFWLDPRSKQPKILVQFSQVVPPLLWIPVKPSADALYRVFEECMEIESNTTSKHIQDFEQMLADVNFKDTVERNAMDLHNRLMKYINNMNPREITETHQDHENTVHLFVGNVEDVKVLEQHFMHSPFVFNTPLLLGSSNKYCAGTPVIQSIFRSVYSRSVITLEVRCDLQMELGVGSTSGSAASSSSSSRGGNSSGSAHGHSSDQSQMFPVFARINYPSNKRMSHPCASRINRLFGTHYPEDMPFDIVAAFLGNPMTSDDAVRKELDYFLQEYEKTVNANVDDLKQSSTKRMLESDAISAVAHLAVLRHGDYESVVNKIQKYPNPMMRIAGLKGAAELGLKHLVERAVNEEKDTDVLQVAKSILENWDYKPHANTGNQQDTKTDDDDL